MTYNDGANKISEIHFYQYIYYIFIRYSHFNLLLLLQSLLWLTNGILVNLVSIQKKVSEQREKKSLIKFFDQEKVEGMKKNAFPFLDKGVKCFLVKGLNKKTSRKTSWGQLAGWWELCIVKTFTKQVSGFIKTI